MTEPLPGAKDEPLPDAKDEPLPWWHSPKTWLVKLWDLACEHWFILGGSRMLPLPLPLPQDCCALTHCTWHGPPVPKQSAAGVHLAVVLNQPWTYCLACDHPALLARTPAGVGLAIGIAAAVPDFGK